MKFIQTALFVLFIITCYSCGSGDTGDGYHDTTGIKANSQPLDSNVAPMAGDRGNPDSGMRNDSTTTINRTDSGFDTKSKRK
jgi:hypothetical protein